MPRVAQRDQRGASDEVVCVLAGAFGFESADDYGRANEATFSRPRAQARRARALAKVNAFVSRHGLAFSPPISPPISPHSGDQRATSTGRQRSVGLAAAAAGFSAANPLARAAGFDARGLFHRDAPPAGLARCRNAADRARRVRLRRVVSRICR